MKDEISHRESIRRRVLNYLEAGHRLSGLDGFKLFSTLNVRSRISELLKDGYPIKSEFAKAETGETFKYYWLEKTT